MGRGGGVWGGVHFTQFHESHGFTSFWGKRHIFKATGGAIMGGRMEGCLNSGGCGVGQFSVYKLGCTRGFEYT